MMRFKTKDKHMQSSIDKWEGARLLLLSNDKPVRGWAKFFKKLCGFCHIHGACVNENGLCILKKVMIAKYVCACWHIQDTCFDLDKNIISASEALNRFNRFIGIMKKAQIDLRKEESK